MSSCQLLPQAKSSLQHIIDHINSNALDCNERPLVIGLSGLPGLGKTTLSHTLGYILEQEHDLPTMTLCLDKTSAEYSLVELMEMLEEWIRTKEYSVIFVEGALMGYRAIPSTHRIWSQLLERQLTANDDSYHTLIKFNETLASLETHLYPLIDTFIQLSANHLDEWRSVLGNQSTVHQLYLERLDNYGFFDEGSSSSSPVRKTTRRLGSDRSEVARHLVLYLDQDRKLVRSRRIVDGLSPPQEEDNNRNGIIQRSSALASTVKRITATSGRDRRRTWMSSALMRQQRKYIIETLNPRVLISFAMMSLLGLLGYSRRLSFILDLFNKIHHFVI